LTTLPASAQVFESTDKHAAAVFLFRMQRQESSAARCVVVYPDHRAHYEVTTNMGKEVFEGQLTPENATQLDQLLPALRQIDPASIPRKTQFEDMDLVMVNVLMNGGFRSLQFVDGSTRKPFKQTLDPTLKWFGGVRKGLEAKKTPPNNCMPQATDTNPPLKAARVGESARMAKSIAEHLLLSTNDFKSDEGIVEDRCVAVAPDGRYRYEFSTTYQQKTNSKVYEGTVADAELARLKDILNEPSLRSSNHNPDPQNGIESRNTEIFTLAIPREDRLQELRFYSNTGLMLNYQLAADVKPTDNDERLLKPLRSWLKDSIEKRKNASPLANATANHCAADF